MINDQVRKLKKRLDKLKSERSAVEEDWLEVEKYCYPAAQQYGQPRSEFINQQDRFDLNDSIGVLSANLLSRSMHASITPPNYPWIDFILTVNGKNIIDSKIPLGDSKRKYLSEITSVVREEYEISNYNKEASKFFKNVVVYGVGTLFQESIFDRRRNLPSLSFTSISPWEIFPIENDQGSHDSAFRIFKMTAQQINQKWPEASKNPEAKNLINALEKEPDRLFEIIHFVEPEKEYGYNYCSKYILCDDDYFLKNDGKGFNSFPYHFLFWERVRNKVYANSPALEALPDVKELCAMRALQKESYEKCINGVWATEQGNFINGEMDLSSRAVNEVRDINGIRSLSDNARYDVAQYMIQGMEDKIRQTFYIDQIQLPPMEGTPHTATEIQVRVEFQLRILGPMFGSHQFDFLNSMSERSLDLLMRGGRLPEIPNELVDMNIEPVYIGPLAKAQKLNQVTATDRLIYDYVTILAQFPQLAQMRPEMLFMFDWEKVFQEKADVTGVPQTLFTDTRTRNNMVNEFKQQQQAQAELEMAQQSADAYKNISTAEKMNRE